MADIVFYLMQFEAGVVIEKMLHVHEKFSSLKTKPAISLFFHKQLFLLLP